MSEKQIRVIEDPLDSIKCGCGSCEDDKPKKIVKPEIKVVDPLDEIKCGCGSCDDEAPAFKLADPLDEIKCGCGSCDEDHDHDESHDHHHDHGSSSKIRNLFLGMSFVIFFTAIFTDFSKTVDLVLFGTAYILIARKIIFDALRSVFKGRMLDENFLMALATIVAFAIGEYAEGVAVMLFYRVGQLTEDYALNRSKSNISKLLDLKPDMARIKIDGGFKEVHPESVVVDQILSVRPGEKIPLDGEIIKGETSLDTAMLTGESLPRSVEVGDEVLAGTVNLEGVIEIKVTKSYDNSAVSKILNLVREANSNKAVTEKFITKFAKVYTPLVVLAAGLLALIPPIFLGESFETWLYRGAIFLVVSCPCALVISIPLGYFGGLGGAARKGVLIKGGHYLEVLKKAKTLIVDKTGTLTKGNFKLKDIDLHGSYDKNQVLEIAAHIEAYSNHPIAKAVVEAYGHAVDMDLATDIKEIPGKGLEGRFKEHRVVIGNKSLMTLNNYKLPEEKTNGTVLYVAVDKQIVAVLWIEDEIKSHSLEGIKQLKKLGFNRIVMLTGDQNNIAHLVADHLGIDEVYGELLPEDKLSHVEEIIQESSPVIFVGDGINDAPVLTRADVGISMGQLGSDVAIESSDVVLMQDEMTKVADAVKGARFTSNIIWQNIILALGVKAIIMVLGAVGIANLWIAVFGDVGVAFLAILNAGRAIYQK